MSQRQTCLCWCLSYSLLAAADAGAGGVNVDRGWEGWGGVKRSAGSGIEIAVGVHGMQTQERREYSLFRFMPPPRSSHSPPWDQSTRACSISRHIGFCVCVCFCVFCLCLRVCSCDGTACYSLENSMGASGHVIRRTSDEGQRPGVRFGGGRGP